MKQIISELEMSKMLAKTIINQPNMYYNKKMHK